MARWGRSVGFRVDEALGALNARVAQGYPRSPRTGNARTWLHGRHERTGAPEAVPVLKALGVGATTIAASTSTMPG
jgi:hypothetical protein